jgi:hypothetical protein
MRSEVLLHGLLEAFDLSAGCGPVRAGVLLGDAEAGEGVFESLLAASRSGEAGGEDQAVVCEGGSGYAVELTPALTVSTAAIRPPNSVRLWGTGSVAGNR